MAGAGEANSLLLLLILLPDRRHVRFRICLSFGRETTRGFVKSKSRSQQWAGF